MNLRDLRAERDLPLGAVLAREQPQRARRRQHRQDPGAIALQQPDGALGQRQLERLAVLDLHTRDHHEPACLPAMAAAAQVPVELERRQVLQPHRRR